jgi:ribonucleoside-diphosphate reductase alpha chain
MNQNIQVVKRNGRGKEQLNLDKIHTMVNEACKDISGVSASQIEIHSQLSLYNGITTADIQETLIRSASDLISLEHPNYQYVAARLLLFSIRKSVHGKIWDLWTLKEQMIYGIMHGVYDPYIITYYSDEELEELNLSIDHDRDLDFTYAGLRQVYDKYLVQDRSTKRVFETPQFMYMLIAATIFHDYPKETRLSWVKRYYDAISKHYINIPTPIMSGVRTPKRQYASCVLVDCDDSLRSIIATDSAITLYTSQRAGIGINGGRIRSLGSRIRGGEIEHTGVIPFLKKFEASVRCCTQNGVRGGSATIHFPIWHKEIEDILVLKNNKGTEDNRVRKLDYSILLSKLFYERFISNGNITLFSPHDVPGLLESYGLDGFDALYQMYENDDVIPKKVVSARELFTQLMVERAETGRIYIMNIDHCNTHSSFIVPVRMSNLCQEITLPTEPIEHLEDQSGEISLCILSAINLGKCKAGYYEIQGLAELCVRSLDALIDYQDYPVIAAELATKARRSLGVGFIGVAHMFARHGISYNDREAATLMHEVSEMLQFYLLRASCDLAKEKGPCSAFKETKYSKGILPIDTYKKEVDEVHDAILHCDWESLRKEIVEHGLRNSTLTAQMPSESSSVVSNATNGIEPPRAYISVKKSKMGPLKQVVPQYSTLKNNYTLLWDIDDLNGYLNVVGVQQKFTDQSISANTSYNPLHYGEDGVPLTLIINHLLRCYSLGIKTLYYHNTYDGKGEEDEDTATEQTVPDADQMLADALECDDTCDSCSI